MTTKKNPSSIQGGDRCLWAEWEQATPLSGTRHKHSHQDESMWGSWGGGVYTRDSCDHLRWIGGGAEEWGRVAALVNKMTNKGATAELVCVCDCVTAVRCCHLIGQHVVCANKHWGVFPNIVAIEWVQHRNMKVVVFHKVCQHYRPRSTSGTPRFDPGSDRRLFSQSFGLITKMKVLSFTAPVQV